MPSRRHVLAAAGAGLVGAGVGCAVDRSWAVRSTAQSTPSEWPMDRYDPAGTAHHPTASGPKDGVRVAWAHDATEWFLGTTAPIVVDGTLYAAGEGLLALDPETGEREFVAPGPYRSTPARASASAYTTDTLAVTAPSGVFGVNADGPPGVPVLGRLVGAQRWGGPQSPSGGFFGPPDPSTPIVADGTVFSTLPGTDYLVALEPNDGSERWRRTPIDEEAISASFGRPSVRDGVVFVANWPNLVTAYDAATGEQQWQREIDVQMVLASVATEAGVVVLTREGVRLLDASDGSRLWRRDLDANLTEGSPAVADGAVITADAQGSLHALELDTGEHRWQAPFEGTTAPVVADGVVYTVQRQSALLAFGAETGERRFTYRPEQVPLSPPIVGDGVLYAANRRRVVALEEER